MCVQPLFCNLPPKSTTTTLALSGSLRLSLDLRIFLQIPCLAHKALARLVASILRFSTLISLAVMYVQNDLSGPVTHHIACQPGPTNKSNRAAPWSFFGPPCPCGLMSGFPPFTSHFRGGGCI